MPIRIKSNVSTYTEIKQPLLKTGVSTWTPLKKVLTKVAGGTWKEVWPSSKTYVHTGVGYNLNMFTLFGNPTSPTHYIFINEGVIGGAAGIGQFALRTGIFPAGSTLTFINRGHVIGQGGNGSSFIDGSGTIRHAGGGCHGLLLENVLTIDNSAGYIDGGGGGGGATGDFAGSNFYNMGGGGGAGVLGGLSQIDTWGGAPSRPGTEWAGGAGYTGSGYGGGPGLDGQHAPNIVNNDLSRMSMGSPGGISIMNTACIISGTGLDASRLRGKLIGGYPGWSRVSFNSWTGLAGNYGSVVEVNLDVAGISANVTAAWISGGGYIAMTKVSNTKFTFKSTNTASNNRSYNVWRTGVVRFTCTSAYGTDTCDVSIRVGDYMSPINSGPRSCFVAGSMVTMADGSLRAIETIAVGEWVRTAVGVAQVNELYLPVLGDRTLYAMADGKCLTSGEHSLWSRDPETGEQWWATRDMVQWRDEAITGDGPNFNGHEPFDLTNAEGSVWTFATETGWIDTTWHSVQASPDTQLYHLLLDEGGCYFVDGYLVSSIADTGGVDWETFDWK